MKIKLSDYVISYLKKRGIKTFFAVSGGASLHLINSVNKTKGVRYICNHHEQQLLVLQMVTLELKTT